MKIIEKIKSIENIIGNTIVKVLKKIFKKIFGEDKTTFIADKLVIGFIIFAYGYATYYITKLKLNGIFAITICYLAFTVILLAELTIVFIFFYFLPSRRVRKVKDEEWEVIKNTCCYHVTSNECVRLINLGNSMVNLKPTKYFVANLQVFFKPSTYFFLNRPTKEDINYQDLSDRQEMIISVPISEMDRSKIRIREHGKVLIYLGGYNGKGIINTL